MVRPLSRHFLSEKCQIYQMKRVFKHFYKNLVKNEHSQNLHYVLPKDPTDFFFYRKYRKNPKAYLESKASLLINQLQCLSMTIHENKEIDHYVGYIKQVVSLFTSGSLNEEQSRCLMFILGLRPVEYTEIRPGLLTLLEKDTKIQEVPESDGGLKHCGKQRRTQTGGKSNSIQSKS